MKTKCVLMQRLLLATCVVLPTFCGIGAGIELQACEEHAQNTKTNKSSKTNQSSTTKKSSHSSADAIDQLADKINDSAEIIANAASNAADRAKKNLTSQQPTAEATITGRQMPSEH
jgi:hypothetical protein